MPPEAKAIGQPAPLPPGIAVGDVIGLRESGLAERIVSSQAFWVTLALLIICGAMSWIAPAAFASADNFYNITRNFAFIGIMALGSTVVLITGGIDLSIGSIMGVVAIVAGLLLQSGHSWWLSLGAGLGTGFLCGWVNGALIAYVGLSPFIVTLGMLSFARSLAVVLSHNKMIIDFGPDANVVYAIGGGQFLGISNPVWLMLILAVIFAAVLHLTTWGRHLYAIGGNEQAARLTGVPVARVKVA